MTKQFFTLIAFTVLFFTHSYAMHSDSNEGYNPKYRSLDDYFDYPCDAITNCIKQFSEFCIIAKRELDETRAHMHIGKRPKEKRD